MVQYTVRDAFIFLMLDANSPSSYPERLFTSPDLQYMAEIPVMSNVGQECMMVMHKAFDLVRLIERTCGVASPSVLKVIAATETCCRVLITG